MSQEGGNGTGKGTVDDTITGICTGHSSTSYTFTLVGATNKLTGDLTLAFALANPATATTPLTCQNSGASNSSFGFTSVIPQQVTLQAKHGASVSGNFGGTDYEITLE